MYWSLLQKAKVDEEDRPSDEPAVASEDEGNAAVDEAANEDGVTETKETPENYADE